MTETIRCPCCDQPMQVEPHVFGSQWTEAQIAQIQQLRGTVPMKTIGRLFGVAEYTIARLLRDEAVRQVARRRR